MRVVISFSLFMALCLFLVCPYVSSQEIADRAKVYPQETLAIFKCDDIGGFVANALLSDSLSRVSNLPTARLVASVTELKASSWKVVNQTNKESNADLPQTNVSELLECFDGQPSEFVAIQDGQRINWLFAVGCDFDLPQAAQIFEKIEESKRLGFLTFKLVEGQDGTYQIWGTQYFLRIADEFIVFSNKPEIASGWTYENGLVVGEKSLFDSRRFRLCIANLNITDSNDSIQGFVDTYRCVKNLSSNVSQKSFDKLVAKLGGRDVLGASFEFSFLPKPNIDFEYQLYIQQGIPRTGINKLLKLNRLEERPAFDRIPSNASYYIVGAFDVLSLFEAVESLDDTVKLCFNTPDFFGHHLLRTVPMLGRMYYDEKFRFESLQSTKIEQFGAILDSSIERREESATRLLTTDPKIRLEWLRHAQDIDIKTKKTKVGKSVVVSFAEKPENYVKHGDDYYFVNPFNPAWSVEPDCIGAYLDADTCFSIVSDRTQTKWIDEDEMKRVWKYLSVRENPSVFCWYKNSWHLRPIFYQIKQSHASSLSYLKHELNDPEKLAGHDIITENKRWDFSKFGRSDVGGGVGVFAKDNGILFRGMKFHDSRR